MTIITNCNTIPDMARRLLLEEAEQNCRSRGLPMTIQRRLVLQALAPRADHPTADDIYIDVRKRIPEISRTTVYRVLEAFVRAGVARKVCHPGAAARYETLRDRHHHLVCVECGRMTDFEDARLDQLPLPDSTVHGFQFSDYTIQFRGLCANCVQTKPASKPRTAAARKRGRESKRSK